MVGEAVEIIIVAGILLGFTVFFLTYVSPAQGPTMYTPSEQPALTNLAQQVLDRVVFVNAPISTRAGQGWSIIDLALASPGPLYQPQIDDSKLSQLLAASAQGSLCTIDQKTAASALGISRAVAIGYGLLAPSYSDVTYNYTRILMNFFGRSWDSYDFTLIIKPLVNLTICPNLQLASATITRSDPICSGVQQGVWVRSTAGGRVVVTAIYCRTDAGCDVSSYQLSLSKSGAYWQAQVPLPQSYFQGLGDSAGLALIAQRVDYPRASDFYLFNVSSRSLIYGMYSPDGRIWLFHDATVSCGSGNVPALGIRRLDVYTGAGFITLANDVVLNPGVGSGSVKVDACQSCTNNAHCAACWVTPPANALFAVAWAERNSQGGSAPQGVMIIIPLVPTPPQATIRVDTWLRWTPNAPALQSAVATRIVDSQSATYQLQLVLYKKP